MEELNKAQTISAKTNGAMMVHQQLPLICHATLVLLFWCATAVVVDAVHRADESRYFLFIEPDASRKLASPVDDELTAALQYALDRCQGWGTSNYGDLNCKGKFVPDGTYRGLHFAEDGEVSSNNDCLLPNGLITNSLCVHYVRYYRDQIPETEMKKLRDLYEYVKQQKDGGGTSTTRSTSSSRRRNYAVLAAAAVVTTVGCFAIRGFRGRFISRKTLNPENQKKS